MTLGLAITFVLALVLIAWDRLANPPQGGAHD